MKVFKIDKERKKKNLITSQGDLVMSGESVKDKYITNNYGPVVAQEEDDSDSPPLVHFGNIPQDVDLIGMRVKNAKETKKLKLSNFDEDEEEEEGKFSDILKFVSKKETKG